MKNTMKSTFATVACLSLVAAGTVSASAIILIDDDFSSGSISGGISTGNYGAWGGNSAGWSITGGQLVNDTSLTNNNQREGSVGYMVDLSSVSSSPRINLSFDYNVAAGDAIYVHLRAFNETTVPGSWWQNSGATNGNLWASPTNGDIYNMRDGLLSNSSTVQNASYALVSLTGAGTYATSIDISGYALSDINQYESISLAFASNSTIGGGGIVIDNVLVAVPEPSSALLLGLGGLALSLRRRR